MAFKSDEVVFSVWIVLKNKITPTLAKELERQITKAVLHMPIVARVQVERENHKEAGTV